MAIPHRCPVCNGKGGKRPSDLGMGGICLACCGSGIVWEALADYKKDLPPPEQRIIISPAANAVASSQEELS